MNKFAWAKAIYITKKASYIRYQKASDKDNEVPQIHILPQFHHHFQHMTTTIIITQSSPHHHYYLCLGTLQIHYQLAYATSTTTYCHLQSYNHHKKKELPPVTSLLSVLPLTQHSHQHQNLSQPCTVITLSRQPSA
jgi:hypothetical protein